MKKFLPLILIAIIGCQSTNHSYLLLKMISYKSDSNVTYRFGKYPNRAIIVDSTGKYSFPDTLFLK